MLELIALDMDGTLLNRDESISPATLKALESLNSRGVCIAIATGRPYRQTVQILKRNGIEPAVEGYPRLLICNERDLYRMEDGEYRLENPELKRQELDMLPTGRRLAARLVWESNLPFLINNVPLQHERGFVEMVILDPDGARRAFQRLQELTADLPLQPLRNRRLVALRYEETGKGQVLLSATRRMGISQGDVLVMGDSHNDLDMLTAGFRAATTGNADEEIKSAVKEAGGTVSSAECSDGVAEVLEGIIS